MLYTLVIVALALVGAVNSNPIVSPDAVDLVDAQPDITFDATGGLNGTEAGRNAPASLRLCRQAGCKDCRDLPDIGAHPHNRCLDLGVPFRSVEIRTDDNRGLPFAVSVGHDERCNRRTRIPRVNKCFDVAVHGAPLRDIIITK